MQTLGWYVRRLGAMTPGEALWRARCVTRDVADCGLRGWRTRWAARRVAANGEALRFPGFTVSDVPVGSWSAAEAGEIEQGRTRRLRHRADRIAAGRIDLFQLDDHDLGDSIDWNRDPSSGKAAPRRFAPWIDYRDSSRVGDCKFVWELNRHHQLVVLGRAYRATGDERYARAVVSQLRQWLEQCPYGIGINWRSPLELGIRLINWVWAIDLIRPCGALEPAVGKRLLESVYLHLWEISRKYSRGSSANNHLIGEAAGVYIASRYFRELPDTERWQGESRRILCEQVLEQTFPDGATREQSLGYQLFVLQFFVLAGLVARRTGEGFPSEYWSRLHRMLRFVGALGEGGDGLPMFGDCDEGYVLDLDEGPHVVRPWLAVGAGLFEDPELKARAGDYAEGAYWLLGADGHRTYEALPTPPAGPALPTRAFSDSGYYLLQCGRKDRWECISVLFDCGPLGYKSLAAHGHADALSFTLRAFGVDVLVDPGTYDYFSYPRWRDYFRSTRAHNTVTVDDLDQSEMCGAFLWGARAAARCLGWRPTRYGGRVAGEHDGYARLSDPVVHRRTLELDGGHRELVVQDEFVARGRHDYAVRFHLAEHCRVLGCDGHRYEIDVGPGRVALELDGHLTVAVLRGSESPIGGWVSRGYHRKTPTTTLVGRCSDAGPLRLMTRIRIGQATRSHGDLWEQWHRLPTERGAPASTSCERG